MLALSYKLTGSSSSTLGRSRTLLSCLATTIPTHTTLSLSSEHGSVWCEASSVPAFGNFARIIPLQPLSDSSLSLKQVPGLWLHEQAAAAHHQEWEVPHQLGHYPWQLLHRKVALIPSQWQSAQLQVVAPQCSPTLLSWYCQCWCSLMDQDLPQGEHLSSAVHPVHPVHEGVRGVGVHREQQDLPHREHHQVHPIRPIQVKIRVAGVNWEDQNLPQFELYTLSVLLQEKSEVMMVFEKTKIFLNENLNATRSKLNVKFLYQYLCVWSWTVSDK